MTIFGNRASDPSNRLKKAVRIALRGQDLVFYPEPLPAIAAPPPAAALRESGDPFAAVSAARVLGIGPILGAAPPMDLRLMRAFRSVPQAVVVPFLARPAGFGLGLAVLTGLLLWSVNPVDYAADPAFREARASAPPAPSVRLTAAASAVVWRAVLAAGRWIGFL